MNLARALFQTVSVILLLLSCGLAQAQPSNVSNKDAGLITNNVYLLEDSARVNPVVAQSPAPVPKPHPAWPPELIWESSEPNTETIMTTNGPITTKATPSADGLLFQKQIVRFLAEQRLKDYPNDPLAKAECEAALKKCDDDIAKAKLKPNFDQKKYDAAVRFIDAHPLDEHGSFTTLGERAKPSTNGVPAIK